MLSISSSSQNEKIKLSTKNEQRVFTTLSIRTPYDSIQNTQHDDKLWYIMMWSSRVCHNLHIIKQQEEKWYEEEEGMEVEV